MRDVWRSGVAGRAARKGVTVFGAKNVTRASARLFFGGVGIVCSVYVG